jgi:single stranded DNA-binding protein
MASYNKIQLIGQLDDKPTLRSTNSGNSLSQFNLIVPRIETSNSTTAFDTIPVIAWRDLAEKCGAYKKGELLYIEGRILINNYDDPNSGQRKWSTEVEARVAVNIAEVFSQISPSDSTESNQSFTPDSHQSFPSSFSSPPIQNVPIKPVDESSFFGQTPFTENNLEEDVPF